MAHLAYVLGAATLLVCVACESETRDVKVRDFTLHECKQPATRGELATGRETADYAGLECVAWRFSDKGTAIDLINRSEGCGFDGNEPDGAEALWTPKLVQTESNALTYSVSWEFEGPSACGTCLHDFSIAANAVSLDDADLVLKLATRSCNASDCGWTEESLTIPRTALKEGIRCRYVDGDGELRACADDSDCLTPLTQCLDGACQLADPW